MDSNRSLDQLGKLGTLLSDLEFNEMGQRDTSPLSIDELKNLLSSIEASVSDLEGQILSNKKEQEELAAESRKLKKEIRELSEKLSAEVSKLAEVAKDL
jgi:chromosome segregation ATPase